MTERSSGSPISSDGLAPSGGPAPTGTGPAEESAHSAGGLAYSVVVPMLNEAENVAPRVAEIDQAMQRLAPGRHEILIVDDGSSDGTGTLVEGLGPAFPALRLIRHERRRGQSAAIRSGALAARGDWIVTLDGDGQNDPADIVSLVTAARDGGGPTPALVGGLRKTRRDTLSKRLASRFANALRRGLLHDDCPDSGCGLKLIHRAVLLQLPFFNAFHRFIPALAKMQGHRTRFVAVNHRPRLHGSTKYTNLQRGSVGLVDLLGVAWLMCRSKLPPPPAPPSPELPSPELPSPELPGAAALSNAPPPSQTCKED